MNANFKNQHYSSINPSPLLLNLRHDTADQSRTVIVSDVGDGLVPGREGGFEIA